MTDEEQKKIFAKNLNKHISLNQKQQKDVAADLGIKPTTLNTWCTGYAMPDTGKIRRLADYFGIGITDLVDDKEVEDADKEFANTVMKIALKDRRFAKIIVAFSKKPVGEKELICDFFEKFIL